jgi:hypothetical protein
MRKDYFTKRRADGAHAMAMSEFGANSSKLRHVDNVKV